MLFRSDALNHNGSKTSGDRRPVTLIGINFSAKKRNIDEPLIESL